MPAFLPSELPVRARTRQHWIVLFAAPHKFLTLALVVLLVAAFFDPNPMAWILGVVVLAGAFLRWQTWRAESVILTGKRIIRVAGVPETTSTEASLRIDRVSGARLTETVPGKILGYGTIELEAPGDHPGVRKLVRIEDPQGFYLELRRVIFGEPAGPDPDDDLRGDRDPRGDLDDPRAYVTEPLPALDPHPRDRFGRRLR